MSHLDEISLSGSHLSAFYAQHFAYYNTLDEDCKLIFTRRCLRFIAEKQIIGASGFMVGNHVKAMIAASAVQLTLGLDTWDLDYFDVIVIHPEQFDNKATGLKFKGETNTAGYIRLSWKSFIHGYNVSNDNVNLGLHEFSHALRLNGFRGNKQDYFLEYYFNSWMASANEAFYDIKNNRETIFRRYGGVNMSEFLCVCIEHYFESPGEIKKKYPLLYYSTAAFLNQETIDGVTRINIRKEAIHSKNELLKGFDHYIFQTSFMSPTFVALAPVLMIYLYTAIASGFLSGPSLLLLMLFGVGYLRFDYKFVRLKISEKEVKIKKGLLLFRGRKKRKLPLSCLISVSAISKEPANKDWEIIYYDLNDTYFYMDALQSMEVRNDLLFAELGENRIAYFK